MSKKDEKKRAKVRKLLLTKWGIEASDRDVATKTKLSRSLVSSVRREMIAAGELPDRGHVKYKGEVYKPGSQVRGGYVWDGKKVVREAEWLMSTAAGRKVLTAALEAKSGKTKPEPAKKPKGK